MQVSDRAGIEGAAEHRVLSEACGLLDRSERGRLALTGGAAREFLNGQVTNEVELLEPGAGCYAALLTHKGKMLADLRVLRPAGGLPAPGPAEDGLWLDTERVGLQALFDALRRHKVGYDVELHKRTLEQAMVSLIGPRAREVLREAGAAAPGAREHANVVDRVGGVDALVIATDVGVDVVCEATRFDDLAAALELAGGQPVSEQAAECLRVERGRPRYGIDLDEQTIPQEAALNERAVSFTKGCYVGQETVARLYYRGKPNRHLRGLALSAPAASGAQLRAGERVVGTLGSVATSAVYGQIALALVRREAGPGDELSVGAGDATARVVELPFGS